jgi:hypothetical protein
VPRPPHRSKSEKPASKPAAAVITTVLPSVPVSVATTEQQQQSDRDNWIADAPLSDAGTRVIYFSGGDDEETPDFSVDRLRITYTRACYRAPEAAHDLQSECDAYLASLEADSPVHSFNLIYNEPLDDDDVIFNNTSLDTAEDTEFVELPTTVNSFSCSAY